MTLNNKWKRLKKGQRNVVTAREIIRKTNNNSDGPLTFRRADGSKKKQEKKFFVQAAAGCCFLHATFTYVRTYVHTATYKSKTLTFIPKREGLGKIQIGGGGTAAAAAAAAVCLCACGERKAHLFSHNFCNDRELWITDTFCLDATSTSIILIYYVQEIWREALTM